MLRNIRCFYASPKYHNRNPCRSGLRGFVGGGILAGERNAGAGLQGEEVERVARAKRCTGCFADEVPDGYTSRKELHPSFFSWSGVHRGSRSNWHQCHPMLPALDQLRTEPSAKDEDLSYGQRMAEGGCRYARRD